MKSSIRDWRRARRHSAILRDLRSLPPRELSALGIRPLEIPRLAYEASRL
jgi:uncharacterized protein YjiS (DUF1127 family)